MRRLREAVTALVVLASLAAPVGAVAQSIYREGAGAAMLYVDHRARAVNDIVTIVIVEQAASSVTANTKTERRPPASPPSPSSRRCSTRLRRSPSSRS
jgi:flagellar basal body L-ring protein FlgH